LKDIYLPSTSSEKHQEVLEHLGNNQCVDKNNFICYLFHSDYIFSRDMAVANTAIFSFIYLFLICQP